MKRSTTRILAMLLLSSVVYADADSSIIWTVPPSDTTYQYLVFLFGTVSPDLMCYSANCSLLIPQLFSIFNQGLLAIGAIVMTYVLLVSTGSSAQDGAFMGKKGGSSIWTPVRIMSGVSFLVPTQTGYSILQVFMMKVILMGVALANTLYCTIGNYVIQNDRTFAKEMTGSGDSALLLNSLVNFSSRIFIYELCYAAYAAEVPFSQSIVDAIGHGMSTTDTLLNGPTQLICANDFFGYEYTTDQDVFNTGCDFTTPKTDLCGSWQYQFSSNDPNPSTTQNVLEALTLNLRGAAELLVANWVSTSGETTVSDAMTTATSVNGEKTIIQEAILGGVSGMLTSVKIDNSGEDAFVGDWMYFPLDFYGWIDRGSGRPPSLAEPTYVRGTGMSSGLTGGSEYYKNIVTKVKDVYGFFNESEISAAGGGSSSVMKLQAPNSSVGPVTYMYSTLKTMVNGDSEPLISLAIFGQSLIKLAINMLLSSIIIGGIMVGVSAICSSVTNMFAMGMTTAFMGFFTSLMTAFGFLIPMGVTLGIYLPLIPGMTYCSGVIVWFMMVIETMVAGPIIALGLLAPGQDSMGKSHGAILMLLNVFLRPSLMVFGMVFGAKMFDLFAIYFSNIMMNGFEFIGSKAGFDAWYGVVFFIFWFFYAFAIVGIAQRCYSMIYLLPDKVITWIGGQSGSSSRDVQEDLAAMKEGADKGGETMKNELNQTASGLGKVGESVGGIMVENDRKEKG